MKMIIVRKVMADAIGSNHWLWIYQVLRRNSVWHPLIFFNTAVHWSIFKHLWVNGSIWMTSKDQDSWHIHSYSISPGKFDIPGPIPYQWIETTRKPIIYWFIHAVGTNWKRFFGDAMAVSQGELWSSISPHWEIIMQNLLCPEIHNDVDKVLGQGEWIEMK